MQPWTEKGGSSSGHNGSLHYDRTLSHLNHHPLSSQQQSSSSGSNGFRTARDNSTTSSNYTEENKSSQKVPSYNFLPVNTNSDMMSLSDGSEVMSFLNSTRYSDHVHGDDLRPDSMSYISHRHQIDTQHGLAESEKLIELMGAEDIVEYLRTTNYTDDIYGIPVLGQYIKEAKEVIENTGHSKIAIERLSMIRNHLVEKAHGDIALAAQNAFGMNENDWSASFLDSSI